MSIEQTLERIAAAIEVLARHADRRASPVFVAAPVAPPAPAPAAPVASTPAPAPVAPKPRGRPPGPAKTVEAPAPAPAPVESDPFAESVSTLTEGDVRSALQALRDKKGRTTEVFDILRRIGGVDTLPALKADKYAAVIAAAAAVK